MDLVQIVRNFLDLIGVCAVTQGGTGATTAAGARTNLGLGTAATHADTDFAAAGSYQASDSDLTDIAALSHAKGKLMVSDASVWTTLAVGTNGQVLTADSSQATGLKYATAPAAGAGGSTTQLNYNLAGVLTGVPGSVVDATGVALTPTTTSHPSTGYGLNAHPTYIVTGSASNFIGVNGTLTIDATTSAAQSSVVGVKALNDYQGSGTLTSGYGLLAQSVTAAGSVTTNIGISAGAGNLGAGTIADNRGMFIATPSNSGGGAITNNFGIYMQSQLVGTNKWACYSEGGTWQFLAGAIGDTPLKIQRHSGQTADLLQFLDSDGTTVLGRVTSSGELVTGTDITDVAVTGAVTLTSSGLGKIHVCSGTSANYTVGLPTAVGHAGETIGFRMATGLTKLVTLDGNSSETINGATTRIMWAGEVAVLESDGANWFKIGGVSRPQKAVMRLAAASQSIPNTTWTKVLLDATDSDNTGAMADLTNHQVVVFRSGMYKVGVVGGWVNFPASAVRVLVAPWFNGVQGNQLEVGTVTGGYPTVFGTQDMTLTTADTVDLRLYQNSGGAADAVGNATATACLLTVEEINPW